MPYARCVQASPSSQIAGPAIIAGFPSRISSSLRREDVILVARTRSSANQPSAGHGVQSNAAEWHAHGALADWRHVPTSRSCPSPPGSSWRPCRLRSIAAAQHRRRPNTTSSCTSADSGARPAGDDHLPSNTRPKSCRKRCRMRCKDDADAAMRAGSERARAKEAAALQYMGARTRRCRTTRKAA